MTINRGRINNKDNFIYIVMVIVALYLFRIFKLDVDLPPWGIINYQPMDEGQYATMALEKYNYGSMRMDLMPVNFSFLTCAHIRNDIFGNVLVYIGLLLFGDTYYGFRISSVFVGMINLILFLFVLKKVITNNKLIFLGGLLFVADFSTMMFCRVVETSVYRELFIMTIIAIMVTIDDEKKMSSYIKFFIIGFLAVFSVFGVYITNVFLPIAVFMYILIKYRKDFYILFESMVSYIAGCLMAYVLCDIYYAFVWNSSCILNTLQIITDFGVVSGYTSVNGIKAFINIFSNIFSINMILYNVCLGSLVVGLLPNIIKRKDKPDVVLFIFCILGFYILQTFLCEDYIIRKGTMMYPLLIILLFEYINNKGKEYQINKVRHVFKCLAIILLSVYVVTYRLEWIGNGTNFDFSKSDKLAIWLQLIVLLLIVIISMTRVRKKMKILFLLVVSSSLLINSFFDIKYVWSNDSYTEKTAMVDIGEQIGNNYVYGIYSIGFTLYNDIKPVVNTYEKMSDDINNNNDILWYLDYESYLFPTEMVNKTEKDIVEKYNYNRGFITFGINYGVSIYAIE